MENELVTPEFIAGNIKKFSKFIAGLDENDKVALIIDEDPDGLTAGKMADEAINSDKIIFLDHIGLNKELAEKLRDEGITKIITVDLSINDEEFIKTTEEYAENLLIDHHQMSNDWNSERTTYINAQGFCTAYISYYLFSIIKDLEEYDWLVAIASAADYQHLKNELWMRKVYEKYGEEYSTDANKLSKTGKFGEIIRTLVGAIIYARKERNLPEIFKNINKKQETINKLKIYADKVQEEVDGIIRNFEKEKEEINGRYYYETKIHYPIKSLISTIASEKEREKTLILRVKNNEDKGLTKISLRNQEGREDMNLLAKKLTQGIPRAGGGGHKKASGAYYPEEYHEEILKRIKELESL